MQKPEQRRDLTEMSCASIALLCLEAVECDDWAGVLVKSKNVKLAPEDKSEDHQSH